MTKYVAVVVIAIASLAMMGCSNDSRTLTCPVCNEKPTESKTFAPGTRLSCRNGHAWWLNPPTTEAGR